MTTSRVTQSTARVVSSGVGVSRVTQLTTRVVSTSYNRALVTQSSVRIVSTNTADAPPSAARPQVFVCT